MLKSSDNTCGLFLNSNLQDFPCGTEDKNLPANTGNVGLIPGLRRSHTLWSN